MLLLLSLSLIALVLTKAADVVTTVRGVTRCGGSVEWERNPFARWAFRRWGLGGGICFVMCVWVGITTLVFVPAIFAPGWYQIAAAGGAFIVSWVQWDVARMNATGRHSRLSSLLLRLFSRFSR